MHHFQRLLPTISIAIYSLGFLSAVLLLYTSTIQTYVCFRINNVKHYTNLPSVSLRVPPKTVHTHKSKRTLNDL